MRKFNRFAAGSGVFKCITCERMTRDTGQAVNHLCEDCFEIAGLDNQVNDSGEPCPANVLAECNGRLQTIAKRGGNVENVKATNTFIWEKNSEQPLPLDSENETKGHKMKSQPTTSKRSTKMAKTAKKAMTKTQKTLNLVAKEDGKIPSGALVDKIQKMCKFNSERTARTYLFNARKQIKAGRKPTAATRTAKPKKELTREQKDAANARRRANAAKKRQPAEATAE